MSLEMMWNHLSSADAFETISNHSKLIEIIWTHLKSVEMIGNHSNSIELIQSDKDSLELNWTHLSSLKLTWTHLNSLQLILDLTRTHHLNSLELNRTAQISLELTPQRGKGKEANHLFSRKSTLHPIRAHSRTKRSDFPVGLSLPPTSEMLSVLGIFTNMTQNNQRRA